MKKRTKNSVNGFMSWVLLFVMVVAGIGIGGLFIKGTFLDTFILEWLPAIVHTVVGYVIAIGSILGAIIKFLVQ